MSYTTQTTLQRTAAGLLLISSIPAATADCFFDSFGREVCTGLPTGARVGIGIGVFFLVMLLLLALGISRRRRIQRANQAYITNAGGAQTYPVGGHNYNQNSYNAGQGPQHPQNSYNAGQPQYPPQSYNAYGGTQGYNGQTYAQPASDSPPQYPSYGPPPGAPPTGMNKE